MSLLIAGGQPQAAQRHQGVVGGRPLGAVKAAGPSSFRILAIEKLTPPAICGHLLSLFQPFCVRLTQQITLHLPANGGVAGEEPREDWICDAHFH